MYFVWFVLSSNISSQLFCFIACFYVWFENLQLRYIWQVLRTRPTRCGNGQNSADTNAGGQVDALMIRDGVEAATQLTCDH